MCVSEWENEKDERGEVVNLSVLANDFTARAHTLIYPIPSLHFFVPRMDGWTGGCGRQFLLMWPCVCRACELYWHANSFECWGNFFPFFFLLKGKSSTTGLELQTVWVLGHGVVWRAGGGRGRMVSDKNCFDDSDVVHWVLIHCPLFVYGCYYFLEAQALAHYDDIILFCLHVCTLGACTHLHVQSTSVVLSGYAPVCRRARSATSL